MNTMLLFIFLLILSVILLMRSYQESKNIRNHKHFDEMQEIYRSRAYKLVFNCISIVLGVYIVYDIIALQEWIRLDASVLAIGVLTVAVLVFDFYCIKNDAFFYVGQQTRFLSLAYVVLGIINIISFVGQVKMDVQDQVAFVKNNCLVFKNCYSQLFLGVVFCSLGVMAMVKRFREKNPED